MSLCSGGQAVGHTRPFSCIDCDWHQFASWFPLFFLEYLFSKGNMQPGLKTFLQISPAQIGLFWGVEGFIISVFIFHPPFISMRFFLGGYNWDY